MQAAPIVSSPGSATGPLLIEPRELLAGPLRRWIFSDRLAQLLSHLLNIEGVNQLYASVAHLPTGTPFYEGILRELNVRVEVDPQALARIPAAGPLVVVANHPLGALEGVVLILLLTQARQDARVMANYLMSRIPQLSRAVIPVDPFGGQQATHANLAGMREALGWLRGGGALGLFPAGEVSHWNPRERRVVDSPWNPNVAGLARRAKASVLPVYFAGSNGLAFHLGGLVHPRLRTAQLARELMGKRDRCIEVRIGSPIPAKDLETWGSDAECIEMLRHCTYLLGERRSAQERARGASPKWLPGTPPPMLLPRAVARQANRKEIAQEVMALPASACLVNMGELAVYVAEARQCPGVVKEIGRLRELTFRAAGEGSGKPRDLDAFDQHYRHLFVWSHDKKEIVGAYRAAVIQEVLEERGPRGLYLPTLFHLQPGFFEGLGPAVELGRSFVRAEYQRTPSALLMLWKGIAAFVLQHPECTRLIGPVSISNAYTQCSRQILVDFLRAHSSSHPLSQFCRPRKPFQPRRLLGWRPELTRTLARELDDVSALISGIEADGKGVPVLLRQYLKLGGQILAFNVDPQFSNVLDGLIVVDLLETQPKALARYMGKEELARFLALHASATDGRLAKAQSA